MIVAIALYALVAAAIFGWLLCLADARRPADRPPLSMILLVPPFWLAWLAFALVAWLAFCLEAVLRGRS